MNIKGLVGFNQIVNGPGAVDSVQKAERIIKSDNTEERDANGQQFFEKQKKKEKMTQEQFDKALALLNKKAFMAEMKWTAFAVPDGDFKYAEVRSESGEIIRKISEFDMWELFDDSSAVDEKKGQLLKKTA